MHDFPTLMLSRKRILIVLGFLDPVILAGVSRYAREAGWILNAFSVYHGSVPKGWQADGLLTTNVFRPDLVRFVRRISREVPTVLHGCNDLRLPAPNVECDEYENGRMLAQHCGISLRGIYNEFQADLRSTPMACLLRLRRAQDLLRQDIPKIEYVAEACGFNNLRAFHLQEGMPPTQWKQANRLD